MGIGGIGGRWVHCVLTVLYCSRCYCKVCRYLYVRGESVFFKEGGFVCCDEVFFFFFFLALPLPPPLFLIYFVVVGSFGLG